VAAAGTLTLAPAARADLSDGTDTNGPPVAQPVGPDTGPQTVAPKAQPVEIPDDVSGSTAQPANPPPSSSFAPPADPGVSAPAPADQGAPAGAAGPQLTVVSASATRFDEANAAYNAGRYGDAVIDFTDFVRTFPGDRRVEEALFHLAESYRELGRTHDALAAYTYQVGRFPSGPFRINAELQRGAILFDQGKTADALAPLQYAFEHAQGGVLKDDAEFLLGRVFLATQKEPAGRALLQSLVDAQPPGKLAGTAAQVLAELDDAQGKPGDALPLWEKALALLPPGAAQATAAARGGWSALGSKQPDKAQTLFTQALKLGATGQVLKVANTGLLRALFAEKKYSFWVEADAAAKDDVLPSARAEILYDRGHANFAVKAWPASATAFDMFLREFPDSPAAPGAAYERMLAVIQADPTQTLSETETFLKAYPQSPEDMRVLLLQAQELSRQKNFILSAPLWEKLATVPDAPGWPGREVLLERARAYDELRQWPQAATSYRALIAEGDKLPAATLLTAEERLAIVLQSDNQLTAAVEAWQAVQAQAPAGSSDQQLALESLGLIYAHGGPTQRALAAQTFRELLDKFPKTKLHALAAYSVGDYQFQQRDYAGAQPYLEQAREADPATWNQPATQRLALGAYSRQDWTQALQFTREYDAIAGAETAGPLPAPLFYALAQDAQKRADLAAAEDFYRRVTIAAGAGDLNAGAWWQLGEVQSARKEWAAAVTSYIQYGTLKPDTKSATSVLLALGRAQLGAGQLDAAKATANQALLQEPEGPLSAAARMLLAEVTYASANYAEAARMFATLALLFDQAGIAPQAMARAADSFEKAGDAKSAAAWRAKLRTKYPQFQATSYL
jgi:TolA-binding protein